MYMDYGCFENQKFINWGEAMEEKKLIYVEPSDYIPKKIRKKYGLGEFAENQKNSKQSKEKKNKSK